MFWVWYSLIGFLVFIYTAKILKYFFGDNGIVLFFLGLLCGPITWAFVCIAVGLGIRDGIRNPKDRFEV